MKRLLVCVVFLFVALPAWAGHKEQGAKSPFGEAWFCNTEVAEYVHPYLPAKGKILNRWESDGNEYIALLVYKDDPEHPFGVSVNKIIQEQLGPVVFFQTLPDGRVLCQEALLPGA